MATPAANTVPPYAAPVTGPLYGANATTVVHRAVHALEKLGRDRVLKAKRSLGTAPSGWSGCYLACAYGETGELRHVMVMTGVMGMGPLQTFYAALGQMVGGLTAEEVQAIIHLHDTQQHVLAALTDAYLEATSPAPDRRDAEALLATLRGDDATREVPPRFVPTAFTVRPAVVFEAEVAIDFVPEADTALALAE